MKAILIDPEHQSITEVEHDDTLQDIYDKIEADCITTVRINEAGDSMFLDDEGLYRQSFFFRYGEYPFPLAGKALVLGIDHDGFSTDILATNVESLEEHVRWITGEEAVVMSDVCDKKAEQQAAEYEARGISFTHLPGAAILRDRGYTDPSE